MKNFVWLWTFSLAAKFLLAAILPMTTDETYYWVWSLNPQLSYYDHPPFVGWMFWLGHAFETVGNAVRWPAVLLSHLTILVWYYIWKSFLPEYLEKFSWWFVLALLTPMIGFGSVIVTPDIPVILFWSLSLFYFFKIFDQRHWKNYLFLGIFLGLGFCAKYHIVLFALIALVYLSVERRWREINFRYALITIMGGLIFCLPVLIWNFQNDFISFRFQLRHGLAKEGYELYWTWSYVLAQIIVLFPTLIWCAAYLRLNKNTRLIAYFAYGPILFFFLTSFKGLVEVNWPVIAYPAFFVLAVLGAKRLTPVIAASAFWVCLFATLSSHLIHPWIPNVPERVEEFSQFEPLIEARKNYEPLFASTYQMASWVWYTTKDPIYKLRDMSRFDFFDSLPESDPKIFPIYVAMKLHTSLPLWIEDKNFRVIQMEQLEKDIVIVRVDKL